MTTRWKVLWDERVPIPAKAFFVANTWQHLPHLLFLRPASSAISRPSYFVNNRRFTEFFWPLLLPIVTKHELGLPFPPRNLRIKFGVNPSTIFLVIVVTDRHTTNAGENIFPRFRGDNSDRRPWVTTKHPRLYYTHRWRHGKHCSRRRARNGATNGVSERPFTSYSIYNHLRDEIDDDYSILYSEDDAANNNFAVPLLKLQLQWHPSPCWRRHQ